MANEQSNQRTTNIQLLREVAGQKGLSTEGIKLLEQIMAVESGGGATIKNAASSATGLFQFTKGTWAAYADKHENEITREGRFDPKQQVLAAIYLTQDNEAALKNALGYQPSSGEFYLAHFLGAGGKKNGAINVIKEAQTNPDRKLSDIISAEAMKANGVQVDKDGKVTSKGVRLKLVDGGELLFKDFTVSDAATWSHGKMNEKAAETDQNRKFKRNSSGVIEALGDMVMSVLTYIGKAISGGLKFATSMFSGSTPDGAHLPAPKTPALTVANSKTTSTPGA